MDKFTFELIKDKYTEEIKNNSNAPRQSFSQMVVKPSGCVMPLIFKNYMERILNFEVFPDDTWVITFPKCGTTWTQEMVWLLKNHLDFKTAKDVELRYRVPFIEFEAILENVEKDLGPMPPTIETARNLKPPRCIKSHLPLELLPKQLWTVKPKIVYVVRDPRDVAISYYHHHRLWNGYQGTIENFVDVFINDRVVYAPYWGHLLSFMEREDQSHILINSYEEMKKDLSAVIKRTAAFLNVDIKDEDVELLKEHLSFKNMKENKSVNCDESVLEARKRMNADDDSNLNFIRRGEAGVWKEEFGSELLEKFKKWNEKNLHGRKIKDYPFS